MTCPASFQVEGRGIVSGAFYVVRRADDELFEHLVAARYCHLLAPRQIGKSSLRTRTQERLRADGVRCASVDLTGIGTLASPDEWYFSLAAAIAEALELEGDIAEVWGEQRTSPVRRFRRFLHEAVLGDAGPPVVIFIDEIDVTLALPFPRDDFFGMIRGVQQARADDPRFARLTFCLIGVAAPLDLIANPERTPFSSSMAVNLEDFTAEEARAFLPGLEVAGDAEALLAAVLGWTDGHPALTQRLCYRLAKAGADLQATPQARVEALVRELFLVNGRIEDPILHDAQRRFAGDRPDARIPVMLHLYQRLLADERVPADGNNPRQFGLRIAGLAAERRDAEGVWLRLRNRIFGTVFDRVWVEERLARRFLTEPLQIWKDSGKKDDHVLRGDALEIALGWARGRDDVTPDERDFLQASQAVAHREQDILRRAEVDRERRERAEQQVRTQRRNAMMLTGVAVIAVLLAGVAQSATMQAEREERKARIEEERATRLAEQALRTQRAIEDELEKNQKRAQSELDTAKRAKEDAEQKSTKARREADDAQQKLEDARGKAGTAAWALKRLRNEAQRKQEDADRLEAQARDASRRELEAKQAASAAAEALKQKDSIIRSLQDSLALERASAARKEDDVAKLRQQVETLTRGNRELKEKVEALTKERDSANLRVQQAGGGASAPRMQDHGPTPYD